MSNGTVRERVVREGKELTSNRGGKNTVLRRLTHVKPVKCALDGYLKESCLHRSEIPENSPCGNCIKESLCTIQLQNVHGGTFKVTPAPVNSERRAAKNEYFKIKRQIRESLRASQRQQRYAKRRHAQGRVYISKPAGAI